MKKFLYEDGRLNWLYVIIAANIAGFLIASIAFNSSNGDSQKFFAIHSGDPYSIFKIWKLLTYTFFDDKLFPVVSNIVCLTIFAIPLSIVFGNTKLILNLYLQTTLVIGIVGGLLCLFLPNNYPIFLLGFSMANISIASACIYKIPNYQVKLILLGNIPIWIIGMVFLLFKIFTFPSSDIVFMLVLSLIAAALGLAYMYNLEYGYLTFDFKKMSLFNLQKQKRKGKLVAIKGNNNKKTPAHLHQEKLNAILDKISEKGLQNISEEEKKFLENYSKG